MIFSHELYQLGSGNQSEQWEWYILAQAELQAILRRDYLSILEDVLTYYLQGNGTITFSMTSEHCTATLSWMCAVPDDTCSGSQLHSLSIRLSTHNTLSLLAGNNATHISEKLLSLDTELLPYGEQPVTRADIQQEILVLLKNQTVCLCCS